MAFFVVVCSTLAWLSAGGCRPNLEFEQRECESSEVAKSGDTLGYSVTVRPRSAVDWHLLVNSPFDWSGDPPRSADQLSDLFGHPTQEWQQDDRPFVSYAFAEGTLQLGLESDRSGSHEYRTWRLRWKMVTPQPPSQALEESTFRCVEELLPSDGTIVILDQGDLPRVSMHLEDGYVAEWIWVNLFRTNESLSDSVNGNSP
jgi:hypothetical protein